MKKKFASNNLLFKFPKQTQSSLITAKLTFVIILTFDFSVHLFAHTYLEETAKKHLCYLHFIQNDL